WHWPVFNIADCAISVGVLMMLIDTFRAPAASDSK
ncbi:signal peptidase II, partial [Cycloclasticus sp. 46_83_sub15_T18]